MLPRCVMGDWWIYHAVSIHEVFEGGGSTRMGDG